MGRRPKTQIHIDVVRPIDQTALAIHLIRRFSNVNKLYFDLTIVYDFGLDDCGEYHPYERYQKNKIFINPLVCGKTSSDLPEPFCPGYVADISIFGVTIHEFCHFLQYRIYPGIIDDYKNTFPIQRFYLNNYSNNAIVDEMAEVMTLYITNPYLLKIISVEHWQYFKRFFKSPVACSFGRTKRIYEKFPIIVKEHLKNTFGIVYNVATDTFDQLQVKNNANT